VAKAIAILLLLACCLGGSASAQNIDSLTPQQRELLGRLFTDARTAYDAREYRTSIARLEEAYALLPEPNILYRIAEMYEELGDREQALGYYSRYFAERPDAPNAAVVQTRIERLKAEREAALPKTARLTIDSVPQGARVYLNQDERKGVTPMELIVKPGSHTVRLRLDGYLESQRSMDVEAGELRTFEFQLTAKTEVDPVTPIPEKSHVPKLILAGSGVLLAVPAITFLVLAADRQDQLDAWDNDKERTERPANYDSVLNDELTFRVVGWSLVGASAAMLIGAGIWWWIDSDSDTSVSVGPNSVNFRTSF